MRLFHDRSRLAAALAASKLSTSVQNKVMEQARPAVAFVRSSCGHCHAPKGECRLGGLPDWPQGGAWPMRSRPADALSRVVALTQRQERRLARKKEAFRLRRQMTPGPDREEEEIYLQSERLIVSRFNALKSAQMADFPLAFVAQLNLSALSSLAGFDPLLPSSGLLSVFVDVTQGHTPFIFWHDVAIDELQTLPAPEELIEFHDQCEETPWRELSRVECLEPRSTFSIPAFCPGLSDVEQQKYCAWYLSLGYSPNARYTVNLDDEDAGFFDDQLGGWVGVNPLSRDIERELNAEVNNDDSRWRLLFSWGYEVYIDTALLTGTDEGSQCIMIRKDDLMRRRFERVRGESWL